MKDNIEGVPKIPGPKKDPNEEEDDPNAPYDPDDDDEDSDDPNKPKKDEIKEACKKDKKCKKICDKALMTPKEILEDPEVAKEKDVT